MWKKKEPIAQVQVQPEIQPQVAEIPVIRTVPQPPQSNISQNVMKTPHLMKEEWKVVPELPMQPIREVKREDGTIMHLITIDEALNILLNE